MEINKTKATLLRFADEYAKYQGSFTSNDIVSIDKQMDSIIENISNKFELIAIGPGIKIIQDERIRQIKEKGFTNEYDLQNHNAGDLANLASAYALDPLGGDATNCIRTILGIKDDYEIAKIFKPECDDNSLENISGRIKDLAKAGALIAAEIELLKAIEKAINDENTIRIDISALKKLEEKGTDISSGKE